MKIAIIQDWFVIYAGAERVMEQLLQLYPEADLYSLIDFLPANKRGFILNKKVKTSFIQNLPLARQKYRYYAFLMPYAVEQFDFSGYDLVISCSHSFAKGVLTTPKQMHVCYCFTPIRYVWDLYHQYLSETGLDKGLKSIAARIFLHYIRTWDASTANRPDHFVAISKFVSRRINKTYGRDSDVIYPPVYADLRDIPAHSAAKDNFYITASRMVPYKRIDLIVEAFSQMPDKKLIVIGEGPEYGKIRKKATTANIELLDYKTPSELYGYMSKAKAFIFAAEEDFGITPVEAQACGTPVIAYESGGVRETVIEGKTGIFFNEQSVQSLKNAVIRFEGKENSFDSTIIRKNAERFGRERFLKEFKSFIDGKIAEFHGENT